MQGYRTQVNNSRPAGCLAEQWTNRDNLRSLRETGGTHWCLHDHRPCDSQHEQSLECFEYKQISSQQNRQMHFDQFVLITALNQTLIYFGGGHRSIHTTVHTRLTTWVTIQTILPSPTWTFMNVNQAAKTGHSEMILPFKSFGVGNIFNTSLLCSPRLLLFDQK